jgi:predicted nucleotidyltransferase
MRSCERYGRSVAVSREELFRAVKNCLTEAFGSRLRGVVLFGSEARGEARPDSDIDLFVLLDGEVDVWEDGGTIAGALLPLQLAYENRLLTALPLSNSTFEAQEFSIYRQAKREGILL